MEYILDANNRKKMLSTYLSENIEGIISAEASAVFLRIFSEFYTPDNNETRFDISEIQRVRIQRNSYGSKCFEINRKNLWIPTSIKKMCGSTQTKNQIIHRALRKAIEPQIFKFKATFPLDMLALCPLTEDYLGPDAQVDHEIPFHILANHFLTKNSDLSYFYSIKEKNYIIEEPHRSKWQRFHQKHAKLRWLSKEANKTAHFEYSKS
jgi:hypothetical protein